MKQDRNKISNLGDYFKTRIMVYNYLVIYSKVMLYVAITVI